MCISYTYHIHISYTHIIYTYHIHISYTQSSLPILGVISTSLLHTSVLFIRRTFSWESLRASLACGQPLGIDPKLGMENPSIRNMVDAWDGKESCV